MCVSGISYLETNVQGQTKYGRTLFSYDLLSISISPTTEVGFPIKMKMSRGKVAPASPRPSTSDELGQSSPPSSRFPSSTTAKPLSFQKEEEELNRPTTPIEEEVIDPLDLSCSVHDSFLVNLNNKEKLPFHVKEYNVHQEDITSKLSRHIYHPLIAAWFHFRVYGIGFMGKGNVSPFWQH